MKILYVITRSDVMGGASVHLLDLAQGARQAGHDVVVLVGGDGIFSRKAREQGLVCLSLQHMLREISPLQDVRAFFELKRVVAEHKPDVIHLHSSKAGILGRLVARSLGIPAVFTAHGWAFTEGVSSARRILYRFIESRMAPYARRIITVSNYDRQLALRLGVGSASLITTIHNGMPSVPAPAARTLEANGVVRMIMVARFDAPKNHAILLETLAGLKELPWSLELVGDGPLLAPTIALAEQLGLQGRVVFPGACNDVASRLARADIFILISNWEGLPLTVLEAMRAGLPVIASDVGGVPEAIEHARNGFLVARDDKAALARAVETLVGSVETRDAMGRCGRERFEQAFTFECMLEKTLAIYSEIISRDA